MKGRLNAMQIRNSTPDDRDAIFRLYGIATDFQKQKGSVAWPEFDPALVDTEIEEGRQWKLLIDESIACVWATTFSDPLIWGEKDKDPSVYIHRIAVDPAFRGKNLVSKIVVRAREYARTNGKEYLRLDTVGENKGLIDHYTRCGFDFLGLFQLHDTSGLPAHYHLAQVSLFEMRVG